MLSTLYAFVQAAAYLANWTSSSWSAVEKRCDDCPLAPKVFIISMFKPEADIWHGIAEFDILAQNFSVPGFSPLFPDAYCTANGDVCQLVTGESEINAASTMTALAFSPLFDLRKTYFMVAGIAGISPKEATINSVTFAKYAIQVALQYELDAREKPDNFSTGYFSLGSTNPNMYPRIVYGTEVFEVSDALRQHALSFARTAVLNDSDEAIAYRAHYAPLPGSLPPSVVACDVATSDVYFSGTLLSEAFENTTKLLTNGSGVYCTTAQEDNATLEVLTRSTLAKRTDFGRIIIMRTASDFDRPYPGEEAITNLIYSDQGAFLPSVRNIYLAGIKVVQGILDGWDDTFEKGIEPTNYLGDICGTLEGPIEPGFGLPTKCLNSKPALKKRTLGRRNSRRTT